ncbi:MAG: hypothetical protein ACREP4_02520 [Stenotrophomonas sp.]|uniref:hypothetical protein n=1 Tax=Stenotrophomonas sp. TaxID=69392 RepID=UPI003D6D3624
MVAKKPGKSGLFCFWCLYVLETLRSRNGESVIVMRHSDCCVVAGIETGVIRINDDAWPGFHPSLRLSAIALR